MCGIAGGIFPSGETQKDIERAFAASLLHRGPDDKGTFNTQLASGQFINLTHTRLSIIDLSESGHQPFHYENLILIFNGEIYNYVELRSDLEKLGSDFHTQSDTEVLAMAWATWGESCLEKLDGMFAFAVFDKETQFLTLARDPFGVKPLYWTLSNNRFTFSSTPSALLSTGTSKELDHQAIFNYLIWGQYDLSDRTFFKAVRRLESGCLLKIDLSSSHLEPIIINWWDPNPISQSSDTFYEASKRVQSLFLTSVERQMRSDAPLGFALSGGVDSSAIVSAARKLFPDRQLKTFGYCAFDEDVSEERWIDIVDRGLATDLTKVRFDVDDVTDQILTMSSRQDEPFSTSRIFAQYKVFESASLAGVKVVLEGQGGDELFAGYHGFAHLRIISLIETGQFVKALKFIREWSKWPGRSIIHLVGQSLLYILRLERLPIWVQFAARNILLGEKVSSVASISRSRGHILNLKDSHVHKLSPEYKGRRVIEGLVDALTVSYLPQLVRQGDRNSMAHSVENRVPFLGIDLVNYVLTLPEEYLISQEGETKSVLKSAMRGIAPDEILDRKDKVGFETPQEKLWSSKPLLDAVEFAFGPENSRVPYVKFTDPAKIKGKALRWRYLNLALWLRQLDSESDSSQEML